MTSSKSNMVRYSASNIETLRQSGRILHDCLEYMGTRVKAGVSTLELDRLAEAFIVARGGEGCFKDVQGYGYTICASINEESVHGMPNAKRILRDGDIISIDCGVRFGPRGQSMCTDACRTFPVGKISPAAAELIAVTKQAFEVGIFGLKSGDAVKTIGKRIDKFIDGRYGIVDTYFGHGIGRTVHEGVLIPNFDVDRGGYNVGRIHEMANECLHDGAIICIEPMINAGAPALVTAPDGWTAVTRDGKLAAHYENTIIVWKTGVEVVT